MKEKLISYMHAENSFIVMNAFSSPIIRELPAA